MTSSMSLAASSRLRMAVMIGLAAIVIVLGLAATSNGAEAADVGYDGADASVVTSELGIMSGGLTTPGAFARWQGLTLEYRVLPAWFCGLNAVESWLSGRGYWQGYYNCGGTYFGMGY